MKKAYLYNFILEAKKTFLIIVFLSFVCFILSNQKVCAEQTIINVPSSEVLPAENIILKESNRLNAFFGSGTTLTPSVIFGVGRGFEFATGVGTTINENNTVKGNFSAKKVFFLGNSTRLTIGGTINPYFSTQSAPDSLLYTHLSKRIKKTRTSITAGAFMHGQKSMPNESGVLFGIEQVVVPNKLRLVMDWISGDDFYGKMGAGIKYRPIPSLSITSAVIIPNRDEDTIGFNVSVSKFISLKDYKMNKKEDIPCQESKNL